MNPLIELKKTSLLFLVAFVLLCFGLLPQMRATLPPEIQGNPYRGHSNFIGSYFDNNNRLSIVSSNDGINLRTLLIGSYFSNNKGLCIVTSNNGINLRTLYRDCYIPSSGVFRDPSIVRWNDTWYVAYTARYPYSVWGACNFFGLIKSRDLQNWIFIGNISTLRAGTQTWAPEWFVDTDGSLHLFVSLSDNNYEWGGTMRIYEMHPTDNTFLNWSSPAITTINNNGSLITNNYDSQVIYLNGSYNMLFTDGGGARCGVSANRLGPYDTNGVGYIIPNNSLYGSEGMNAFLVHDTWRMIVDATSGGKRRQLYTTWNPGTSFLWGWSNYTEITLDGVPAVGPNAYHHGTLFKVPLITDDIMAGSFIIR